MRRLLVVTNPTAGSAGSDDLDAALAVLRNGADVVTAECARPPDLEAALAGRQGRTVVVAGGDGSLHTVVAALRRRGELSPDEPLGLMPLGTGNDLARTLGIPRDGAAAARGVLDAPPRSLDLIVDETGGVVVNAVHVGLGAEAAERAGAWKGALGPASYAVGSTAAGATATGWEATVTADGTVVHKGGPVLMVAVANGRTIGGGTELAPEARPDDGRLDVVVATSTGPLARLGFAVAIRAGDHGGRDDVTVVQAATVTIAGAELPVNADGELTGTMRSRTWAIEPAAWSLLAPTP